MTPLAAIAERLRVRLGLDPATLGARALAHAVRGRARARGLDGAAAYLAVLERDGGEWDELIDAVVVPETWFFRDREPFALLARWAARAWARRSARDPIAILSLPCATGEEAWSIAIALAAAGVTPDAFHVEALDVSARALAVARAARYPVRALRGRRLDAEWVPFLEGAAPSAPERGGAAANRILHVAPALHASVHFARGNLVEARRQFAGRRFDCVFSRNLLIYCDAPTRAAAIATFTELLRPDGLLVLGHAETLPARTPGFVREGPPAAFAWRRVGPRRPAPPPARAVHGAGRRARRGADDARALADRGELTAAAAAVTAHLAQAPDDAAAHALLGVVCAAQGRDGEAIGHLRRALHLDPANEEALAHLPLLLNGGRRSVGAGAGTAASGPPHPSADAAAPSRNAETAPPVRRSAVRGGAAMRRVQGKDGRDRA